MDTDFYSTFILARLPSYSVLVLVLLQFIRSMLHLNILLL